MHWGGGGGWHGQMRQGTLSEDEALGRVYDHKVVMRFARYLKPHKKLTLISTASILVYTATTVASPYIIKLAIDLLIEKGDIGSLTWIASLFIVNAFINFGANYTYLIALAHISQGVLFTLRTDMFNHLQRLSVSFHDRNMAGKVMSRVQNDVTQLQEFLQVVVMTLADGLSLVGIIVVMLFMDVKLALITLAVIPVLCAVLLVWQQSARRSFMRVRKAIAVVNAGLQENISGMRVVQSLNREDTNIQRFNEMNSEHLQANIKAGRLSAALFPIVEVLTAISIGLVIIFGGNMVLKDQLAIGTMVAFVLYIQRFFEPIRSLTMQYEQFQRAMVSGSRIFGLLDTPTDLADASNAKELPKIKGDIRFEKVGFHYVPGIEVLNGVDLHIRPGENLALVGATGAGKSTVVSLIARFYDVTQGRILVDGYDLREVTKASLAHQMSMVLQDPFLFSGTVKDNIRYNRVNATDDQVISAAKAVGAHDFIMKLSKGYDSPLQERGVNLSLGQRQLVTFARALLADPRILILDEATANIDSYTESVIQQALRQVLTGRTSIIIAHRLSTVRNADRIIVMDKGQIIEEGNHNELMAKGKVYAQLYNTYFASQEAPAPA